MKTRIALMGYGNLSRGVECALKRSADMELVAVFTRRAPEKFCVKTLHVPVLPAQQVFDWKDKIDVLVLCGGSATDLPQQTPRYADAFNVIDSFDTHANVPAHFDAVDAAAKKSGKIAVISCGWDPGMFSLNRLYSNAILPDGKDYTFWGRGVSQGHSDAVRRIEGVLDARQYTVPAPQALQAVRSGECPTLSTREMHTRECYVVAAPDADKARIEREIKTMPNYFSDYDTTVHFISAEEMQRDHAGLPHGGFVIRNGVTGWDGTTKHIIEYRLTLDSNPEFTGSVIAAFTRAAWRMNRDGQSGCKTVFDIPPAYLSEHDGAYLRAHLL